MNETWLAFLAGAAWLAVFTAGLFAFADWVQRRDRRRANATSADGGPVQAAAPNQAERKGGD
ncbi:hypothetical protein [Guyparkeria sp.]|uniref:hypothetical protein n=1 Tax=Guyparkeria sp. TaxID=2035736 RepID=UPI0039709265